MILDLFIPEILNNSFLIKRKVLSVYFSSKYICISIVLLSGKNKQVVFSKKNIIQEDSSEALETLWTKELQKMTQNLEYDQVYFVIPSSSVLFKFQTFNLEDIDQIKMILPIELENVLPIGIDEIALDAMSLDYSKEKNEHKIVSVICKKETLAIYQDIAKNSQIKLDKIIVDIMPLYNFVTDMLKIKTCFLTIISQDNLTSTLFENGVIKSIKNSFDILKKISNPVEATPSAAISATPEKPFEEKKEVIEQKINSFADGLKDFTSKLISEYEDSTKFQDIPHLILITHDKHREIREDIDKKISNVKYIDTSLLQAANIQSGKDDQNSLQDVILPALAGLYYENLEEFNLLKEQKKNNFVLKLTKQIYVFSICFITILGLFFTNNIINIKKYNQHIADVEKDIINFIKNNFDITYRPEYPLEKVYKEADQSVLNSELIWNNLSSHNKYLYLKILEKISTILKSDLENLVVEEIQFKKDNKKNMQIQLKVKATSYETLKKLEEQLKNSKLFTPFAQAQDLEFTYNLTFVSKDII